MVDETLGLAEEAALHAVRADRARSRHSLAEVHVDGRARGRLDALQLTRRRDVEALQHHHTISWRHGGIYMWKRYKQHKQISWGHVGI